MKIVFKNIIDRIKTNPSKNELSEHLFQLGHEHEVDKDIFDMEFTPNRGDCLSVHGLLRDLSLFYDTNLDEEIYTKEIKKFSIDFKNNQVKACPHIAFLKVEIGNDIAPYKDYLEDYFNNLKINKNNFFTDVSNYISYEIGQPTHCYEASKLDGEIKLDLFEGSYNFKTLLDTEVELKGKNLVFMQDNNIINLAGIVGGKNSSCNKETRSVIIECAYFHPESIIGKSVEYDIKSDAAHKFERGVDPTCHEKVLRRFLKIIEDHAHIKNVELFQKNYINHEKTYIPLDVNKINKILGTEIGNKELSLYLKKLAFKIIDNKIEVPSHRHDISSQNDIAEEIARAIGYDNIKLKKFTIKKNPKPKINKIENNIKDFLLDNGFYEVINNPFVSKKSNHSIRVDNPLDSNRGYLRTSLKESLINNLLYNERRQKDSIKLFEISNIYSLPNSNSSTRKLGIIASGVVGKNYIDFSKKITNKYLHSLMDDFLSKSHQFEYIERNNLDTKINDKICYLELNIDEINPCILEYKKLSSKPVDFIKYKTISEYPSSSRDLSFLIKDKNKIEILEKTILGFRNKFLKDVFIFDYYENESLGHVKIAYRFTFQSNENTLTVDEVNSIIKDIISLTLKISSVSIPGLKQ